MRSSSLRMVLIAVLLGSAVCVCGAEMSDKKANVPPEAYVMRWTQELTSRNAVRAAAAAYWLGRHAAATAVPQLVAVLGDNRPVNPSEYREEPSALLPKRSSPGQEAAAALANIGQPAVDALIRTLQTNTNAIARQNAAWALGQISERGKPAGNAAVPRPPHEQDD
jgi:PBS lyase HEAT-like repeat